MIESIATAGEACAARSDAGDSVVPDDGGPGRITGSSLSEPATSDDVLSSGEREPYQESDGPDAVTDADPRTYDLGTDDPRALALTQPLRTCDVRRQLPGCPRRPVDPDVYVSDVPSPTPALDAKNLATMLADLRWAQEYYFQRFGWSGRDGKGAPFLLIPHSQRDFPRETYTASVTGDLGRMYVTDEVLNSVWGFRATAVHELTHLLTYETVGDLDWSFGSAISAQEASISEALAEMATMETASRWLVDSATNEYTGRIPNPLQDQPSQKWLCPPAQDNPATRIDDRRNPYVNAHMLERAYADIALNTGTATFGQGRKPGDDVDPNWEGAANLRWAAMTVHLRQRNADGELTFGEVRGAFVAAAGDVGMDPGVVGRAFDRQGITSEAWEPPPCDYDAGRAG